MFWGPFNCHLVRDALLFGLRTGLCRDNVWCSNAKTEAQEARGLGNENTSSSHLATLYVEKIEPITLTLGASKH